MAPLEQPNNAGSSGGVSSHHVYVKSEEHGWVPARLRSIDKGKNQAVVEMDEYPDEQSMLSGGGAKKEDGKENLVTIDLRDYQGGVLPLQNTEEGGELAEFEDMVDLPYLHEVRLQVLLVTHPMQMFLKEILFECGIFMPKPPLVF